MTTPTDDPTTEHRFLAIDISQPDVIRITIWHEETKATYTLPALPELKSYWWKKPIMTQLTGKDVWMLCAYRE